jgi:O-antigen/teichoic acid export membrane protein
MRLRFLLRHDRSFEAVLIASLALAFATTVVIARVAGPAGRGQMSFVAVWVQILGFGTVFMLDTAVIVRSKQGEVDPVIALFEASRMAARLGLLFASGAAGLAIWVLGSPFIAIGMAAGVIATAAFELANGYLLATDKKPRYLSMRLSQPLLYLGAVGLTALLLRHARLGVQVPVMALCLVVSLSVPAAFAWLRWIPHERERSSVVSRSLKRFVGGAQLASVLKYLNSRLDLLALPLRFASPLVGIYAVAAALPQVAVSFGAAGELRGLIGESASQDRRANAFVALLTVTWFATCGWLIPAVFGARYEPSVPVARILAVGILPGFALQQASGRLLGQGRTLSLAVAQGAGAAVFLLGFLLSSRIEAVAWASSISYLVSLIVAEGLLTRPHQNPTSGISD